MTKRRSGEAVAARSRTSAGPMRHRLQPRGGARNDQADLLEDADEGWTCYAKPAGLGRTCGHVNTKGIVFRSVGAVLLCCEECGCTQKASDDRRPR